MQADNVRPGRKMGRKSSGMENWYPIAVRVGNICRVTCSAPVIGRRMNELNAVLM